MLERIKAAMTWQMATVVVAGGVLFGAIALFAPEDVRASLLGANGLLWTIVTALLRAKAEE